LIRLYREFETQEQIDVEYRVASPEDVLLARRRVEILSAEARNKLPHRLNVAYGPTKAEYLDIFPCADPGAPVFVFLHGGYWRAMSSGDYSYVAIGPVSKGILTVSVNYALAPHVRVGEIVRQTRAAVAWVMRNIQDYGGDPGKIIIGGHSAGAQLAAMCALARWSDDYGLDSASIKGALLVSGVFDLSPLRYSFLQPQLQLDDWAIIQHSPINWVDELRTPLLLAVGASESQEFRRQTRAFYEASLRTAIGSEMKIIPGADHFTALDPLLDPNSFMCSWLRRRVSSPMDGSPQCGLL
jgi:arylformamidase